jgi:hypothetical protein
MKLLLNLAAAFALAVGFAVGPALAQDDVDSRLDTVFGEHDTFRAAFDAFTAAVKAGDAATVASLAKYPFEVNVGDKKKVLANEGDFIKHYGDIFTPAIVDIVTKQSYDTLFVNQDGVMFGDGQVWLTSVCTDDSCNTAYWVISAINLDS